RQGATAQIRRKSLRDWHCHASQRQQSPLLSRLGPAYHRLPVSNLREPPACAPRHSRFAQLATTVAPPEPGPLRRSPLETGTIAGKSVACSPRFQGFPVKPSDHDIVTDSG